MLLALVCAASTYIGAGIPFAAAQSAGIEELVDEHGVTPTFELTPAQRRAIYQELHKERSGLAISTPRSGRQPFPALSSATAKLAARRPRLGS